MPLFKRTQLSHGTWITQEHEKGSKKIEMVGRPHAPGRGGAAHPHPPTYSRRRPKK